MKKSTHSHHNYGPVMNLSNSTNFLCWHYGSKLPLSTILYKEEGWKYFGGDLIILD